MKRDKVIYWIFTGLISVWMLWQGGLFIIASDMVYEQISGMGFPQSILIPLGVAKILAVVAILTKKSTLLKKLAYYGLGIDFILALGGHLMASDGLWPTAAVALILLTGSFIYDRKVFA